MDHLLRSRCPRKYYPKGGPAAREPRHGVDLGLPHDVHDADGSKEARYARQVRRRRDDGCAGAGADAARPLAHFGRRVGHGAYDGARAAVAEPRLDLRRRNPRDDRYDERTRVNVVSNR